MLTYRPVNLFVCAVFVAATATALAGCSAPDKPNELVELERILGDKEARQVGDVPGAGKYYREARQYRQEARNAYNDGDIDRAREYALLGKLRYRTAEAVQKQHEAKERLDEANAKVGEINPQVEAVNQERNKLKQEVNELERKAAQARKKQKQREQRQKALKKAAMERNEDTSEAEQAAVRNKIESVHEAKTAALEVRADEFAEGAFNRAENRLRSTMSMFEDGSNSPEAIMESADKAADAYRDAANEARPAFREHQQKMQPVARRASLRDEASKTFGKPYTFDEAKGVRVVLAMLFEKDSSSVRSSANPQIESVAKLAEKYDEADLMIEGYTRKGDATQNLATSQVRAKEVRDLLEDHGIDKSRLSTSGKGQERTRFDEADKNDRVEIIFRIPD